MVYRFKPQEKAVPGVTPPRIMVPEIDIARAVTRVARDIERGLPGFCEDMTVHDPRVQPGYNVAGLAELELHLVVVLDGAFVFAADLVRALQCQVYVHFVGVHSYDGMERGERLHWDKHLRNGEDIRGKHVVVVDDIIETGRTMSAVSFRCREYGASKVETCSLVFKDGHGAREPDHAAFRCRPTEFVVGYGLDLDGRYRDLPYLGTFDR